MGTEWSTYSQGGWLSLEEEVLPAWLGSLRGLGQQGGLLWAPPQHPWGPGGRGDHWLLLPACHHFRGQLGLGLGCPQLAGGSWSWGPGACRLGHPLHGAPGHTQVI